LTSRSSTSISRFDTLHISPNATRLWAKPPSPRLAVAASSERIRSSATPWTENISFSVNTSVEAATTTTMPTAMATSVGSRGKKVVAYPIDQPPRMPPVMARRANPSTRTSDSPRTFTALSAVISNVR